MTVVGLDIRLPVFQYNNNNDMGKKIEKRFPQKNRAKYLYSNSRSDILSDLTLYKVSFKK